MMTPDARFAQAKDSCASGSAAEFAGLLDHLRDARFVTDLDDPHYYPQRRTPPHLAELLACAAARSGGAERLVALAKEKTYAGDDREGSLRRTALVQALGAAAAPVPAAVVTLLDRELADEDYRSPAVAALARLATPESVEILRRRVFDPRSDLLSESTRDIYLRNYTVDVAQSRDRPAALTLLLGDLCRGPLTTTVVECLAQDTIRIAPDPQLTFALPRLDSATPDAVTLAGLLGDWLVTHGLDAQDDGVLPQVSGRVTALLGLPASAPASGEEAPVRAWLRQVAASARNLPGEPALRAAREALAGRWK